MKHLLIIIFIFVSILCRAQFKIGDSLIEIDDINLLRYKVYENIFLCNVGPFSDGASPIFFDETNFNVGTTLIDSKSKEKIYESDIPNYYKLNVVLKTIELNSSKKSIRIAGYVAGGWYGAGSQVHVYIGQRIDTTLNISLSPNLEGKIYYNGKRIKKTIIIDTLPAFRMEKFAHSISEVGYNDHLNRIFVINSPIDENSILVFGLSSSYAEIYEIGELLKFTGTQNK